MVEDAASNQSETSVADPTAEPGPAPPLLSAAQPEVPAEPDQGGAPARLGNPSQAPRPTRPETALSEPAFQTERTPTEPPAARRALTSDRTAPEPAVLSGALPDPAPFTARRDGPAVSAAAMPDGLPGVVPGRSATTFAMARPPVRPRRMRPTRRSLHPVQWVSNGRQQPRASRSRSKTRGQNPLDRA